MLNLYTLARLAKLTKLTTANVDKGMELLEL